MSYRRSISFSEHEVELLNFFDSNGKSDIAKEGIKKLMKNTSELPDALMQFFGQLKPVISVPTADKPKLSKLVK
jgi:hypothetical protein